MITRTAYFNNHVTHQEYYIAVADVLGRETLEHLVLTGLPLGDTPVQRLSECLSTDYYLNNIPLRFWDMLHPFVVAMARSKLDTAQPITESRGWSMGDTVCVLKSVARAIVNTEEE